MSRKRYVVTGGTGFIGAYLVRRLVADGHDVVSIDNDLRGAARRLADLAGRFTAVQADVRDVDAVTQATKGADCILHLAALNGTENFYNRPELVLDVGVRGMLATLEAARRNGITEFVLASSSEAYQTPPVVPTPEDVPLMIPDPWNPRYSYGGSKLISEIMLANYNKDLFTRAMIFRPHNVYGADMGFEHVLPQFVMRAVAATRAQPSGVVSFPIQGDGSETRSFIHVDDFIDGVMCMLARGEHRQVYHIGTLDERSIADVVGEVFAYFGREHALVKGPLQAGGTRRRCPDIAKLAGIGFSPKVPLREGVAGLAAWYVANEALWPEAHRPKAA